MHGVKNPTLNNAIIEMGQLRYWMSKARLLTHFYHVDTYGDDNSYRLQGYVFVKDIVGVPDLGIPECEVAYMDDEFILFMSFRIRKPE